MKKTKQKSVTTLSSRKRDKIISGIISDLYKSRYSPEEMDRVRKIFVAWFENGQDSEIKDKYLFKLLELEKQTPEDLERVEKMLKECKRRLNIAEDQTQSAGLRKRHTLGRVVMRVAAVVVPLLMVVGGVWFTINKNEVQTFAQDYNVSNGVTEELNLPDSTKVKINSGSTLAVKFEGGSRVVKLSGESFFDVAKEPNRPFVVHTDEFTVTVLGTQFNVESYSDRGFATVMLVEGSVSLNTNDGREWVLSPNQLFVYDKNSNSGTVHTLAVGQTNDVASWTDGHAVYNYRTLNDIFKIIERRFAVDIEVQQGVVLSDKEYLIQIDPQETPELVIGALAALTDKFSFRIDGDKVFILPPNLSTNP